MRKNVLALALLLWGGFALSAQSRIDASVFITPVAGIGGKPDDNSFFYKQLVFELMDQNITIAKEPEGADFILAGFLFPADNGQFSFSLELRDNKTGEIMVEGELLYETLEDIGSHFPILVSTLLYTIPEAPVPEPGIVINNEWRNKWVYLGASVFWTPRIYTGTKSSTHFANVGGGLSIEFHPFNFLSLEAGFEIASDKVTIIENDTPKENLSLEIPLLLKYVIKPGTWFMVEPYAGVQFNVPFDTSKTKPQPPLLSVLGGLQYGVKAGPGVFFVDGRFTWDIGDSAIQAGDNSAPLSFHRMSIHLGLGYKFGLIDKKKK